MNETRKTYLLAMASIVLFVVVYVLLPPGAFRQVLVYFLVIIGLLFSAKLPELVVIVNGLGLVLLFTGTDLWPVPTMGLALLLLGTAVLPFYFTRWGRKENEALRDRHEAMLAEAERLQERLADSTLQRHNLENEIDRINQLYVLGRELVEHLEMDEVVENMQRVLANNPGIKAVCIFSWEKDGWKPLHLPRSQSPERWLAFVQDHNDLHATRTFQMLGSPEWLGGDSVVFLPVFLEKDLLAALFLVTEQGYAQHYLERASIFIPQIALGLKRTRLFLEVQERSRNDGLTGLYLRRHVLERLQAEIQRSRRYATVFSLFIADLDHFKSVNDTYGHLAGDTVLREVARIFMNTVRPGDIAGRYGGEEFIAVLPLAGPDEARRLAEKLRAAVAGATLDAGDAKISLTISVGICTYPQDGASSRELLDAADAALYRAKNSGRNNCREFAAMKKEMRSKDRRPIEPGGTMPSRDA